MPHEGEDVALVLTPDGQVVVLLRPKPYAHVTVDADGLVLPAGAIYHGGILLADSGGASTVAVYDGLDAGGDLIDYFSALTSARDRGVIERGVILRRGLYVNIGSNVDAFTVFYDPVPQERD